MDFAYDTNNYIIKMLNYNNLFNVIPSIFGADRMKCLECRVIVDIFYPFASHSEITQAIKYIHDMI